MKNLSEILLSLSVIFFLFLKIDPFHWLMPTEMQMMVLCLFSAAVALYAGMLFREKPRDERDAHYLATASRISYLVGIAALSVILVIQDLMHQLDPWLVGVLALMISVKLIALKVLHTKN